MKKEKEKEVYNRYREEEEQEMAENKKNGAATNEETEPVEEVSKETILENQVAQLKDQLLRNMAELENFKRRNNEERIKERKYASQYVFLELIEVIDSLDTALKTQVEDENVQKYKKGFELIREKLANLLSNNEVKKIEALGMAFDPNVHMAVSKANRNDLDKGVIVEELLPGYMYKDRVLRPSMVIVNEE